LVDEAALIKALRKRKIAGAGLDVFFSVQPLPADHPFRSMDDVEAAPHLGYVVDEGYSAFYSAAVENIKSFSMAKPFAGSTSSASVREKVGSAFGKAGRTGEW